MAFAAVDSTQEARSYSLGPLKCQVLTWGAVSGDTTGTVTADQLVYAVHIICDGGLKFTALPTFSGNVATLAFADPAATVKGTILVFGR